MKRREASMLTKGSKLRSATVGAAVVAALVTAALGSCWVGYMDDCPNSYYAGGCGTCTLSPTGQQYANIEEASGNQSGNVSANDDPTGACQYWCQNCAWEYSYPNVWPAGALCHASGSGS